MLAASASLYVMPTLEPPSAILLKVWTYSINSRIDNALSLNANMCAIAQRSIDADDPLMANCEDAMLSHKAMAELPLNCSAKR